MDIDKLLTKAALDTAVKVLLHEQSRCGGAIPHNFYTRILDGLHKKGIVISRTALHKRVSRASAKLQPKLPTVNPSPPAAEVTFARQNGTPSSVFLKYINDEGHKWKVCLGVPYATSLWQVGDASEQNGNFKSAWSKSKGELLDKKISLEMPRKIEPEDVMPLLNRTFHIGFNNKRANLKAVADRGWNPLNQNLLDHPDLMKSSVALDEGSSATVVTTSTTASSNLELNIHEGSSGACLGKILSHYKRSQHFDESQKKKRARRDCIVTNLKNAKRFSSGAMVSNNVYNLDNPDMLAALDARNREKAEAVASKLSREKERKKKFREGVAALRNQFGHEKEHLFRNFSKEQCGTYLQYKKRPGRKDGAMPTSLEDRRKRCVEWIGRISPSQSFDEEEEEEENNIADDDDADTVVNEDEVASVLFNMSNTTVDVNPENENAVAAM